MKQLLQAFRRVLWEEWDPIGVRDIDDDWPEDEYDGYAPQLLGLVNAGKSIEEIAATLEGFETDNMGLNPSGRARLVAQRLIEVHGTMK